APLFPYTTLFRSRTCVGNVVRNAVHVEALEEHQRMHLGPDVGIGVVELLAVDVEVRSRKRVVEVLVDDRVAHARVVLATLGDVDGLRTGARERGAER